MKAFDEDGLDIGRLKNGPHEFRWTLGDHFFEAFEGSVVQKGRVQVLVGIERVDAVFRVELNGQGEVELECDNCLSPIAVPFSGRLNFVVKLADTKQEDDPDNEVYYVTESDSRFFFSQHLYDLINTSLPLRRTCESTGLRACNTELMNKLNPASQDEPGDGGTDPRWDKLKGLFNK